MNGFADQIFGYFAIFQQMGGFANRFATGTGTWYQ
jgi:hypothetical protein